MPNAIWRGAVTFGLVSIPVSIMGAEEREAALHFNLLDGRDMTPVHQKRVNERTGEEVPWESVVKGFKLDDGRWVVLDDDDFKRANVEASQTIEILKAVPADSIDPIHFLKPYFLEPAASAKKAYALLRETLRDDDLVAVARVVIRTREHLAALIPDGDVLLLELLRYDYELRSPEGLDLPTGDLDALGISQKEREMAGLLVDTLRGEWDPAEYHDTYRDELRALIDRKAELGDLTEIEPLPAPTEGESGTVIDIVELLRRSVEERDPSRVAK